MNPPDFQCPTGGGPALDSLRLLGAQTFLLAVPIFADDVPTPPATAGSNDATAGHDNSPTQPRLGPAFLPEGAVQPPADPAESIILGWMIRIVCSTRDGSACEVAGSVIAVLQDIDWDLRFYRQLQSRINQHDSIFIEPVTAARVVYGRTLIFDVCRCSPHSFRQLWLGIPPDHMHGLWTRMQTRTMTEDDWSVLALLVRRRRRFLHAMHATVVNAVTSDNSTLASFFQPPFSPTSPLPRSAMLASVPFV